MDKTILDEITKIEKELNVILHESFYLLENLIKFYKQPLIQALCFYVKLIMQIIRN